MVFATIVGTLLRLKCRCRCLAIFASRGPILLGEPFRLSPPACHFLSGVGNWISGLCWAIEISGVGFSLVTDEQANVG